MDIKTDFIIEEMDIPEIPRASERIIDALKKRAAYCIHLMRQAQHQEIGILGEMALMTHTENAIIAAKVFGIKEADTYHGQFRRLVDDLGYERIGTRYTKRRDSKI